MAAHTEYVVRIEDYGRLVQQVDCDGLRDAALTCIDLAKAYPKFSCTVYRPSNVDLDMPTGLTRDEREQVEEIEAEQEMWREDERRTAERQARARADELRGDYERDLRKDGGL